MKFTTSCNTTYRLGVGTVSKPWIDYGRDHNQSIMKYFYDNIKIWDADICGDKTLDFLFEDGKAFRFEYSWWFEYDNDDDEENGLHDQYYITEISSEDENIKHKVYRDWL